MVQFGPAIWKRHVDLSSTAPMSAGSRAVRLLMSEYGIDVTLQEEQVWERREEFVALNPACTVPVLVEGDRTIVGSQIIAEYLDETHGALKRDRRMFPEDPMAALKCAESSTGAWSNLNLKSPDMPVHERVTKRQMPSNLGGGAPDSQALRAVRANISFHLKYLGWLASNRDWLAGDQITHADLTAAATLSVLDYMGEIEWSEETGLKEWYARMKSRPSFRPLLADRLRGMPPVSHYVDLDF